MYVYLHLLELFGSASKYIILKGIYFTWDNVHLMFHKGLKLLTHQNDRFEFKI